MESVPLIPKSKALPNLDVVPIIRELFQDEFELAFRQGTSKRLSQTILTSLQHDKSNAEENESFCKTVNFLQDASSQRRDNLINFSENIYRAYVEHEKELESVRNAEKNVFEAHAHLLKREAALLKNKGLQELFALKRQPQLRALNAEYVEKYKLLQGEAALPFQYQAPSDFRVQNFSKWRQKLESTSEDSLISKYVNKLPPSLPAVCAEECYYVKDKDIVGEEKTLRKLRPKKSKTRQKEPEIFRAEPSMFFFSNYKPGEVYVTEIEVKNVCKKGMKFQVKPMCPKGCFSVSLKNRTCSKKLYPGLAFQLMVEFSPKDLEVVAEDICISIEEDKKLLIPLVAYLEPPILKTHKDIDECTKVIAEKISSSYIECGSCFTGDTKMTRLRFRCYRGSGEFFIMSSDNWNQNYVNSVTNENLLEIPPFRIYPVYFKLEKNEVIDLCIEFSPKNSGTHVDNIMITCDNGEVRSLDILGDAIGWHSYFFSFQDNLIKELPVDINDDSRVKYFLDFKDTTPTGKVEKSFLISNNSSMPFEFQWKIRDAVIPGGEKYLKLSKYQVKIKPETGTLQPNDVWEFFVTITFDNGQLGEYRMVLSLYVLNLPYQCIEEDNTIIQPTGLVRNLYSQSLYGEEEFTTTSPELLSLQGTYESLQESIKSYIEYQNKNQAYTKDFCKAASMANPGFCAKPLKKSKTFFNIGDNMDDERLSCVCRVKTEVESQISDPCTINTNEIKTNEPAGVKNEVIWDFVDILVDEIELWVEVRPIIISVEPYVLELLDPLKVNDPPIFKEVKIINYSQATATCKWLKLDESSSGNVIDNTGFVSIIIGRSKMVRSYVEEIETSQKLSSESSEDRCENKDEKKSVSKENSAEILDVENKFVVPPLSELICTIGMSANKSGKFSKNLKLSVIGTNLELPLMVRGTAVGNYFSVSPQTMNFKLVRQGTRPVEEYRIKNEYSDSLRLSVNEYQFDFLEDTLVRFKNGVHENYKKQEFLLEKAEEIVKPYYFHAKTLDINLSLFEIRVTQPEVEPKAAANQYILLMGHVLKPSLYLSTARFRNAILAPPGMMYVGEPVTSKAILNNRGMVQTYFRWGNPFGCHSRKIKVSISPNYGEISSGHKISLKIIITPLDEGIINHCYIPCFFDRNAMPLILSIVGITEKINVTFEIIEPSNITGEEKIPKILGDSLGRTVARIHWPLKTCNLNLGQRYLREEDILNMKCQCEEVEEEANQALRDLNHQLETAPPEGVVSFNKDTSRMNSEKVRDSYRSKENKIPSEVIFKEVDFQPSSREKMSSGLMKSIQKYSSRESFAECFLPTKTELDFFNVTFETRVSRQFVIRNETPITSSFHITVKNFGKTHKVVENRILTIKDKIFKKIPDKNKKDEPPLVITVDPPEGVLLGHDAVTIDVVAYGNTWGEYKDFLICQIIGIPAFYLKVFVQIVGSPVYFPMFENYPPGKPILRFQPLSPVSAPASKKIRVVNRSGIPVTISWIIFMTQPLVKEEEQDEGSNCCGESNVHLDSKHSEASSKSVKVYLPKNMSDSGSAFRRMAEMGDFSQNSETIESFSKETLSAKNDNEESFEIEKVRQDPAPQPPSEEPKSERQQYFYHIDMHNFQVDPKEISFEPFEEKKITITFDPRFFKSKISPQEFKAVLTACVKLKPSDEKCPNLFYRPCGMNFLSEILDFNAVVETPVMSLEIVKGDLKFFVYANEVLNAPSKTITLLRKYIIKNKNQKSIPLKIDISPGSVFRVAKVETIGKSYPKFDSSIHEINVEPGQFLEMELECSVTYKAVLYGYEGLKLARKKELNATSLEGVKMAKASKSTEDGVPREQEVKKSQDRDTWNQYSNSSNVDKVPVTDGNSSLEARDSFKINLHRMSSKSNNSVCYDDYIEAEGEFLALPTLKEFTPRKTPKTQNVFVVQEEINFLQTGLLIQTINAELHLCFPLLRLSHKTLDFGNVYIGETAVRYCSLINLTGVPSDYKIRPKCKNPDFVVKPETGNIPSTNYNSDIGITITIEFTPRQPGYFFEVFQIYCNLAMDFDAWELCVSGIGTWNAKFKRIKFEAASKLQEIYSWPPK